MRPHLLHTLLCINKLEQSIFILGFQRQMHHPPWGKVKFQRKSKRARHVLKWKYHEMSYMHGTCMSLQRGELKYMSRLRINMVLKFSLFLFFVTSVRNKKYCTSKNRLSFSVARCLKKYLKVIVSPPSLSMSRLVSDIPTSLLSRTRSLVP